MDGSRVDGGRRGRHIGEDIRIDEIMRGKKTTEGRGQTGCPHHLGTKQTHSSSLFNSFVLQLSNLNNFSLFLGLAKKAVKLTCFQLYVQKLPLFLMGNG